MIVFSSKFESTSSFEMKSSIVKQIRRANKLVTSFRTINYVSKRIHLIAQESSPRVFQFYNSIVCRHNSSISEVDTIGKYHEVADGSLDELVDILSILESDSLPSHLNPDEIELNLSQGVLKIELGSSIGTWVINKQTPNRQIWWSSPISGPMRYEFSGVNSEDEALKPFKGLLDNGTIKYSSKWKSTKDGKLLLPLLRSEISKVAGLDIAKET